MAYYNNNQNQAAEDSSLGMNKKEEDKNGTAPVQLTSASANGVNAGPTAAPLNGNPVGQNNSPKAASSGMGGGFQSYQKANQGVATDRLNAAANKNLANQGQAARTGISQATEQFGKKADAGTLANRYQAVSDVANTVNSARNISAPVAPPAPIVPKLVATGSTDQVPQPAVNNALPAVATQPVPAVANPLAAVEGADRFRDVINAKYQGPESLRQAGLYQLASGKVGAAQNAINQSKTATGREEMLRSIYEKRGDYTRGLNKLDSSILNSSQSGVQALQNTAQAQGNLANDLTKAQLASSNLAQNRTSEIKGIQEEARKVFSEGKTAEEAATEKRLDDIVSTPVKDANGNVVMKADGTPMTQWDQLPEYYRDIIRNKTKTNAATLATETAKIKGDTYDGLAAQTAKAKAALDKAKNLNDGASMYGQQLSLDGTGGAGKVNNAKTPAEIAAYQANAKKTYEDSLAAYNGLNSQKAVTDKQLAELNQRYNPDAVNFNEFEAATLGVNAGEGLYNLGADAIKSGVSDKTRLISKDEQARQAVLAQLAGLDNSNRLDTNLRYDNADKAGTQSILDSLDLQGTRDNINNAEQNFEDTANKTNIKGEGKKKVSRGNAWGKKTSTYKATAKGNAGDFLENSGYDFDSADENADVDYSKNLLNQALQTANVDNDGIDYGTGMRKLEGGAKGAAAGSVGGLWGALIGGAVGGIAGGNSSIDPYQSVTDTFTEMDRYIPGIGLGAVGKGITDLRGGIRDISDSTGGQVADAIGLGGLNKDIGGMVSGIDVGAMKKFGSAIAQQKAQEDLKNKYAQFLDNQGFDNRINVESNEQTQSRMNALQSLLANLDKTNTQGK